MASGPELPFSLVEAHSAIYIGEKGHAPLCRIFEVQQNAHPSLDKQLVLKIATKGMNSSMGPEGQVSSLLELGVIPLLPVTSRSLPVLRERMAALALAQAEMGNISAEPKIA